MKVRQFIRYPGSKVRLAEWIVSHFPPHDTYVCAFGGSGATLFAKPRHGIEVYNDLNGDLVRLFLFLREHTYEFEQAVRWTMWSPAELEIAARYNEEGISELEFARRFYALMWMSHYPFDDNPSFRRQKVFSRGRSGTSSMKPAALSFSETDHLFSLADRLRGVAIESMDALELIPLYDYDRALFYLDPPYVHESRIRTNHYEYEMDTAAHEALANVLHGIDGMAVLSGYRCDLYHDLYDGRGWLAVDKEARTTGEDKTETLWLNPAARENLRQAERAQAVFDWLI